MILRPLIFATVLCFGPWCLGQIGGASVFSHLNLAPSSRVNALGGMLTTVVDDDVSLGFQNPAVLNKAMHEAILFNTTLYFAGINFGYVGYAHHLDQKDLTLAGGLQYVAYGQFQGTDIAGRKTTTFSAGDYALQIGAGRAFEQFRYGANLKVIYSDFESYSSFGLAMDLGGVWYSESSRSSISAVVRNVGVQIKPYVKGEREALPFDFQLGASTQLKYLPLRLTAILHHLHKPDIRYDDPNAVQEQNLFGDTTATKPKTHLADKIFRHVIISGEFLFSENFRVRIGYNHQRRMELGLTNRRGMAGFSFGAGIGVNRFRIDYSLANYHHAGAAHMFTVSTNLDKFRGS